MMKPSNKTAPCWGASLIAAVALTTCQQAEAIPYASKVTNQSGNVSFILNESADNVKVIFDGGGLGKTNDLGALAKGSYSFTLGAASSYEIHVTKSAAPTWAQISDDLNPLVRFYGPRGIAVFNDPSDLGRFGRVYVANSVAGPVTEAPAASARTTGKGIYVLNADLSDALGYGETAQTAGIIFDPSNAGSPFKLELGEDKKLYISDYSNNYCTVYRSDPDVTAGEVVLEGIGYTANPTVHTDIEGSAIAKGSLASGNLVLWAIDGQWGPSKNRLLRWDINAGPLPHNAAPVELGTAGNPSVEVHSDLDIAPDGKFFVMQHRAAGTTNVYDAGRVNLRVYDIDGTTLLFDSLRTSLDMGNPTDYLNGPRALKLSPDGTKLAIIRNDTQVWIIGLTNGIPDLNSRLLLNAFTATSTSTSSHGREVSWDAAGNLYAANNTFEKLRVWSPGGSYTAITRSGGSFELTAPATMVTATSDRTVTSENGANPTFTITRAGDTASALPVNFTLTGSAISGTDYTAVVGNVTFLPGATSTNVIVSVLDDAIPEAVKTLVFTLAAGANYSIGSSAITVALLDDDTPQLSLAATQPVMLEGSAGSQATFTLTRLGETNVAVTAGISYSGSATLSADYTAPATVSIPAGAVTARFNATAKNDKLVEGTETVVATLESGAGYTVGVANSGSATIIDDDLPAGTALFADDFGDYASYSKWQVNPGTGNDAYYEFVYDYSVDGIAEAPNSAASSAATRGLKLYVNTQAQMVNGLSLSPLGIGFTGDYRLVFDAWINFNGPLSGGGAGSSEYLGAGVGFNGFEPTWSQATSLEGIWFAVNGDGGFADAGTTSDWQAWANTNLLLAASGVYVAGTAAEARGNFYPYYNGWGGLAAPTAQVTAYPSVQTGVTDSGTLGMAWHKFVVAKQGTNVSWTVDGRLIATVSTEATTMSTNVMINYEDQFQSTGGGTPALRFAIVDNLVVETIPAPLTPPTITAIKMTNNGTQVQIDFTGAAGDTPATFKVAASSSVASGYGDTAAAISSLGGTSFRAVLSAAGPAQFYKVRR